MSELLIGAGNSREKRVWCEEMPQQFTQLVTLDHDTSLDVDVHHDLNRLPYPFEDDTFHEIHAYEVLEHCGRQGDWRFFFAQFSEFWRILKPNGFFCGTTPMWDSPWAWGDPGHTRIINVNALSYLDQDHYKQVGVNSASDYRSVWPHNFHVIGVRESEHQLGFILRAIK